MSDSGVEDGLLRMPKVGHVADKVYRTRRFVLDSRKEKEGFQVIHNMYRHGWRCRLVLPSANQPPASAAFWAAAGLDFLAHHPPKAAPAMVCVIGWTPVPETGYPCINLNLRPGCCSSGGAASLGPKYLKSKSHLYRLHHGPASYMAPWMRNVNSTNTWEPPSVSSPEGGPSGDSISSTQKKGKKS